VWGRRDFLDCSLCRLPIRCADPVFSYSLSEEHEREGLFDVDRTESALLACIPCYQRHELVDRLRQGRRLLVSQLGGCGPPPGKVVALVSRHRCGLCGWRIADGLRLFTAAFELGRLERQRRTIEELKIDLVACLDCATGSGLRIHLQKMVAALRVECRRQRLRRLR
jgi:hypothetical protein